jgi:hypothetical protein
VSAEPVTPIIIASLQLLAPILETRLNLVEAPGIVAEYGCFVLGFQILSLDDFVDFFHAIIQADFVREVRREHKRLRPPTRSMA